MKHVFNALAVLLLTSGIAFSAMADDTPQTIPVHMSGLREQMREIQFEQQAMAQHERHSSDSQSSDQQAHDGNADAATPQMPDSSGDDVSRNGTLSPEERRTLRQQINEAGHEIYAPSR